MSRQELASLFGASLPEELSGSIQGVCEFYERLARENQIQNLTRLISPEAFVDGHLTDAVELIKSRCVSFPAMDLGSGGGVPGLLCAVMTGDPWNLVDSEQKKAEFLSRTSKEMGLGGVQAFGERAEAVLERLAVESVVVRAVGPVERIYNWIRKCSTWNNLVLLKGPSWEEEWKTFSMTGRGRELKLVRSHHYTVGIEKKTRVIVRLERVPRGTTGRAPSEAT